MNFPKTKKKVLFQPSRPLYGEWKAYWWSYWCISDINCCLSGIYELCALLVLAWKSSLAAVDNRRFTCEWITVFMLPAVLTDENTACILWLLFLSQAHSVALPESACEEAMALKRDVFPLSASKLSEAQFKTTVVSGKETTALAYKSAFLKGLPLLRLSGQAVSAA